jgi:hypothetical protein
MAVLDVQPERDDVLQGRADVKQRGLDVPQALDDLRFQVVLAGDLPIRVPGNLAGEMNETAGGRGDDSLRNPEGTAVEQIGRVTARHLHHLLPPRWAGLSASPADTRGKTSAAKAARLSRSSGSSHSSISSSTPAAT